jgi:serine/threonine protein kinase
LLLYVYHSSGLLLPLIVFQGKYGPIFRANLQLRHGGVTQYAVAKSMPNKDKSKDRNLFLQEAERLVMLSHPSILHCFGVMMDASNTYIVLEYIAEQSLRDYLLKHTDLSVSRRIRIATEVACGLAYLEASQVIHGDISCRNILTNHTGGSKITGFSIWPECLTVTKRWRAIEAWESDDYLSSASDVWSLGICLYEIFNGGAVPFDGQSNTTIKRMLDAGNRLPPGPSCPSMVYSLMVRCWHPCPWLRYVCDSLLIVVSH